MSVLFRVEHPISSISTIFGNFPYRGRLSAQMGFGDSFVSDQQPHSLVYMPLLLIYWLTCAYSVLSEHLAVEMQPRCTKEHTAFSAVITNGNGGNLMRRESYFHPPR